MQKIVLLKEKHLEMPIKREKVMKKLLICSVNKLQLMVYICGKNVQPWAFFSNSSLKKGMKEGGVEKRNFFVPLQHLRLVKIIGKRLS